MMWKIVFPVFAAVLAVGLGAMVGGYQDVSVNDEGAQNALNVAVVEHNRRSNDMFLSKVAEVLKVQRQVVAGTNYRITVRMARTPCRKDEANEVCAIHQNPEEARPYECTFTVWSRPWLRDIKLTKQTC